MTPDQVPAEAARRMAHDPVFHMQVTLTVQLMYRHQDQYPDDVRVDPDVLREVASLSAACALVIAQHPELVATTPHPVPWWAQHLTIPTTPDRLREQGLL